jgi:hypothetical protein
MLPYHFHGLLFVGNRQRFNLPGQLLTQESLHEEEGNINSNFAAFGSWLFRFLALALN